MNTKPRKLLVKNDRLGPNLGEVEKPLIPPVQDKNMREAVPKKYCKPAAKKVKKSMMKESDYINSMKPLKLMKSRTLGKVICMYKFESRNSNIYIQLSSKVSQQL